MAGKSGFVFQGSLTNAGPFASFDNGTESAAIGIDSTGRLVISRSSTEGASSSDVGEFVVDTSGNIEMNPSSTVTISSGNLVLTTGFVETTSGVVLIGATSGNITLEAPAIVTSYSLEFPAAQGTAAQVLTQSSTPGILEWATPTTGTVDSVTATSPVFSSGGANPNITIQAASGSQEGALLAADWTTFNNKVSQGGNSYGATMIIGTNDAHTLELIADGAPALTITSAGNITVDSSGTLALTAGLIFEGTSSGSVTVFAPSTVTSYNLTLPSAQGTAAQVLTQSGTPGILQWSTPTTGTVTSVTASSPVASSGGSAPNITIQNATTSQAGALTSTDWNTFNNKVSQGGNSYGATMSIGTNDGNALDFRTNGTNRVTVDTSGNLTVLASGTLGTTGGLVLSGSSSGSVTMQSAATVGTPYTLVMPSAQGTANQVLSQSGTPGTLAWTSPTSGTVTSVTGTSPIASSGGSTPAISIQNATTSQTGALTSTDWNTFNNKVSDGGNSYGALMTIGTNDNHNLELLTNGANRLTIDTSGNLTIGTAGGSLIFPGTFSGTVTLQASGSPSSYTAILPQFAGTSGQCLIQTSTANQWGWGSFVPLSGGTMTGSLTIQGPGDLVLGGTSSGFFQLLPAASTTSYSITMPPSQGTSGQVLTQSGTPGIMSWTTPTTGTVTSVTGTSPIASSGGSTPAISIQNATTSQTGALTSTDWNTFNNKVAQNGNSYGTTMSIGTNDANNINFITNGLSRWTMDTSGNLFMNDNAFIQIGNGAIFLYNSSSINFYGTSGGGIAMKAPATPSGYTFVLPAAQGAANQVLAQSSSPGTLQWTTPVTVDTMAWYNSASSLAIPNSSTQITFNSVSSPGYNLNPPNSNFNLTTGTFTPAATGYYLVTCNLTFTSTSANSDVSIVLQNITTSTNIYQTKASFPIVTASNGYTPVSFSTVLSLSSADGYGVFATASVASGVTLYTSGSGAMFNNITFLRVQ